MTTTTYQVSGMTCGHCVTAVKEELGAVDGVTTVEVELVAGGVSPVEVMSDRPLDQATVRSAVDEAGYELVWP